MRIRKRERPLRRGAILGALAAAASLLGALPAQADPARAAACGGVQHYSPSVKPTSGRAPLAVGDSIMLGAVPQLRGAGFEVDVRGCRQFSEGLDVLAARARTRTLPDRVVVGLGTNWTIETRQVRRALITLGRQRALGLVTPREVGGATTTDQAVIRAAGERWPGRVQVLDWVAHSAGKTSWFASDGLHLRPRGALALSRLMSRAKGWPLPGGQAPAEEPPAAAPEAPGGGTGAPAP